MKILGYSLAIFILGLSVALRISWQRPQILPKNQPIKIIATLKNEPKIYEISQVLEIGDSRIFTDLYPRYRVGDRLSIEGEVDSDGKMYQPVIQKLDYQEGFNSYFSALREKISGNLMQLLPVDEATLVVGTVLGIDNIGLEFRQALIKTGTIHVVVVSGQNLMIVAGVFLSLVKYIGRRKSLMLALIASFSYALLTGFEPPVLRATLMVLASTLAIYFGRETLPIWNLVLAAFLILFIWPKAFFEISFQLTFAATLGIMTLGQYLAKISNFKLLSKDNFSSKKQISNLETATRSAQAHGTLDTLGTLFINNAAIAVSAYVFTAPIILYYFGRVSILSPIVNVLVIEAVFPIMILGFIVAFLSLIFIPLAQVFAYFAYVPAFYFVKIVKLFAQVPMEQMSLGKGNLVIVISFYILLLVLIFVWTRKSKDPNF